MQSTAHLDDIARIICVVDLDKDDLAWHDGQFYPVYSHSFGHTWRAMQKTVCFSTDSDYEMVAEKVRDFLESYQGGLREQVADQLQKLENKITGSNPKKVSKVKKRAPQARVSNAVRRARINKEEKSLVIVQEAPKKTEINFYKLLFKLDLLTRKVENEYLPYLPITEKSCRCTWIHCPSKTNVKVTNCPEEEYGYIHANTVSLGEGLDFIATIYPLARTVFWSMALEHGNAVLDVTNANDLTRNKVEPYYPQKVGQVYTYNKHMEITCLSKKALTPTLDKYQLQVKDLVKNEMTTIDRLHYTGWEDVCGTNDEELYDVVNHLEPYLGQELVPIVHCMGGVGRTGTALTAVALKKLINAGNITNEDELLSHIQRIIIEGRKQRGPEYVQTDTQLETLWKLGLRLLEKR